MTRLLFIGAGRMGSAIISRLITSGDMKLDISICDPYFSRGTNPALDKVSAIYPTLEAAEIDGPFDVIVLAIKPQLFGKLAHLLKLVTTQHSLVISVMAGIAVDAIRHTHDYSVVRTMPNIGAAHGHSATACFAGPYVTEAGRTLATRIMEKIGSVYWVKDEELLHAVTAVSGSGPAYFFAFVEALANAGKDLGLSPELAKNLAIDTLQSASASLQQMRDPSLLRDAVTSPSGTTAAALAAFSSNNDLSNLVSRATRAANARSIELK
ncbi:MULTISPECIES: pyrroline-5-carboxylate reductase [Thalassospira]|uniref:pyrroline-5-carboxylate reductase n=1 Tax=Thalassospira TaxID=168934 RepID=UPI002941DA85|nr:pyrroline-5-carboxylate reductase [Thalassospira lucentensis]WOI10534.1 pyrroline-5-carboxylate reductase [Thalassospira lucentensis]